VALTRTTAGAPPAPEGLTVSVDTARRIVTLAWDPVNVSDVAGYALFRKPLDSLGVVEWPLLTGNLVTATRYVDTLYKSVSDTQAVTYYYRIRTGDLGDYGPPAAFPPVNLPAAINPVRITFASAQYSVGEGAGAVTLELRRLGPADRAVSVTWTLQDSSARQDSDYVGVSGAIAFAAGETAASLAIPIVDDLAMEGAEVFFVGLSRPGNGAVTGPEGAARVRILDDDSASVLRCPDGAVTASEKDSVASILIRREGETRRRVSLRFATHAGTAKDTADFLPGAGTVTFDSGVTARTIAVRLVNDTVEESGESLGVAISDPSRDAVLSGCGSLSVKIADDDSTYLPVPLRLDTLMNAGHFELAYTALRPRTDEWSSSMVDGDTASTSFQELVATSASTAPPQPVGYWDFRDCGGVIKDLSGNGHPGYPHGTIACVTDAMGTWARFSGDDSVDIKYNPVNERLFDFGDKFTLMATVKLDTLNERQTIAAKFYGDGPNSFMLEVVGDRLLFTVNTQQDTGYWGNNVEINAPARAHEWLQLTGIYDGKSVRFYINGELAGEKPASGSMSHNPLNIVLGHHPAWSALKGGLKEVRIFDKALTITQAWELTHPAGSAPRPVTLTATFAQPRWLLGAGLFLSEALGTSQYRWSLAGAASPEDLDAASGSYTPLLKDAVAGPGWSRRGFKPGYYRCLRFTVAGTAGTGHIQINELGITGAERVVLP
jgi:hypothetical protein